METETNNIYKIGAFAKKVKLSVSTLQRWDRTKILVAFRTPSNRRYYTDSHLAKFEQFEQKGVC